MSVKDLLEKLRRQDVRVEADGELLRVDAPTEVANEEVRAALLEHKPQLLRLLEREQQELEKAHSRGLVIKWAKEPGWIALHDPLTGEWHEVKASECLPGVLKAANAHRKKKNGGTRQ